MIRQWKLFYEQVRDPSWPDCETPLDIKNLPDHIAKELLIHDWKNNSNQYTTNTEVLSPADVETGNKQLQFQVKDIKIYWEQGLDGGGTIFSQDIVDIVKKLYPGRQFNHALEWCAGPAFIGFNLLANDVCTNLTLMDKHQPAVTMCNETIKNLSARYSDRKVQALVADKISAMPDQKFDLVVGNPPHWNWTEPPYQALGGIDRIALDAGWTIHNEFFQNISNYLTDNAVILLIEHRLSTGPGTFANVIKQHGLKITNFFHTKSLPDFWFLELTKEIE